MLISTGVVVELDVELGNIWTLLFRSVSRPGGGGWVGVESKNKAISAFN